MLKLSVAAVAVCAALATACGGSPTGPQSIDVRTTQNGTDAGSAPAPPSANPTTPAPAPAPSPAPPPSSPTPAPAPAPEPTPPTASETWHAHVDVQRASSPTAALPADFTVTVRGDQMQFGPLNVTILVREGTHIYARKGQEITIQIDDGTWTVTSVDVFATGTISYSAP